MGKSDDITEKETEIINNSIIHIEAGDHLITDEAKRHKLALMLVCSFVLMISYYHEAKVGSLFGIIKFSPGYEICVLELIPFAILVMVYHGFIYYYHFNEAKKAWLNKELKAIRADKIIELNNQNIAISQSANQNIVSQLDKPEIDNTKEIRELRVFLRKNLTHFEKLVDKSPKFIELQHMIEPIYDELEYLKNTSIQPEVDKHKVHNYYNSIHDRLNILRNNLDSISLLQEGLDRLKKYNVGLNDITLKIDRHFINKYNYYLEENYKRSSRHNSQVREALTQRDKLIAEISKTAFNKKHAMILYFYLPALYFISALCSSLYVYLNYT